jgi:Common central domain of tyrosinase/von Willebrand factor type A domain
MRCRKNYRDLTGVERDRYVQALHHVKSTGVVDQLANEHETFFHMGIHGNSHFLPWHRDFLRRFEDSLRTFHPDITIPYWNSTVDTSPSDPLWDNAFLGQFDAAWGLGRALGSDTLPTPQDVQTALGHGTYDAFRPDLEVNVHNPPHRWVAGEMAGLASPHDPVFYLHHCWIDLLWAQWQLLNPGAPFVSSGAGFGLNDPMTSVSTTPADVLDHRTINLYQYPPGFQEDVPQVTPDTSVVNFLDVPEGETRLAAAVFSLDACESVHLTVLNGPTVTTGPPATTFAVLVSPAVADPDLDPKGRIWFTYQGTSDGDIAAGTVTIGCDESGQQFVIPLTANTIARPSAAIAMVLDQSNSMNFDAGIAPGIEREDVLKFSAPTAVVVLEDEHAMAVCSFDQDPHPGIGMTPAAGAGKFTINAAIAGYSPNPNGWTSIGEGVAFAHGILDPVTGYDVKAMVVLTDGQENHGPYTRRYIADVADLITSLNGQVFAIGLGRAEVLNPAALTALCNGNSGYMLMTGDLTPDATYRLAKYYQQIFAGVTNNEIVLDPDGFIGPGQEHRIPFWLNEADISAKGILLTPAPYALRYALETPDGDIIDPAVAGAHPMAAFQVGEQVALYRVGLPIPLGPNSAHAGIWYARLKVDEPIFRRYLASLDNYPTLHATAAAHGIRYNFSAHAYSNLRMKASLAQTSNEPGATLILRAVLTEYGVPVTARATCRADLVRPDNTGTTLTMLEAEPGVFETTTPALLAGIYRFNIRAEGRTLRGRPFSREQTLTGAVWRGGDTPPPTVKDDPNAGIDRICRLIDCLLHGQTIQVALRKAGVSVDELRRCLEEYCRKPSPGQPPQTAWPHTLEDRLRSFIPDDQVLQAVMRELERERE